MTFHKNFVAVIKANGKVLKEDRNQSAPTVYLPFGSEYSILLKNLFSRKALVNISIDGTDILNGNSLVINANDELELERFLGTNMSKGNKLKFIEKTEKISDHRGDKVDDGIVRISYQFEKAFEPNIWFNNTHFGQWSDHTVYGGGVTTRGQNQGLNSLLCDTVSYTASIGSSIVDGMVNYNNSLPKNEDGITVAGSESNQKFTTGTIGLLDPEEFVITLMLKGGTASKKVQKPIVITKSKCPTCGTSNGNFAKFCSECGTGLQVF